MNFLKEDAACKKLCKPIFKFKNKWYTGGTCKTIWTIRTPVIKDTYYWLSWGKHALERKYYE